MHEQTRRSPGDLGKPVTALALPTCQALVFPTCPIGERQIKVPEHRPHSARIEATVVVPPAPQRRTIFRRELGQRTGGLTWKMPAADVLTHTLQRLAADTGLEARKELARSRLCAPRPEREAEEREPVSYTHLRAHETVLDL